MYRDSMARTRRDPIARSCRQIPKERTRNPTILEYP